MATDNDTLKLIFGIKMRYLRLKQELPYQRLSELTGLSVSYLHEIERGKKYPKADKVMKLAAALGVDYDDMVSIHTDKHLRPVIELLESPLWQEFPMGQFGMDAGSLAELFFHAPAKVNAFVSTLMKLVRTYQVSRGDFYQAALRSYQDLHDNYFPELEAEVRAFREIHGIQGTLPYTNAFLQRILEEGYGVAVDRERLPQAGLLSGLRSYYSAPRRALMLNPRLNSAQANFALARELAFQHLQVEERSYETPMRQIASFEGLLNSFKASYFAVALLMDEHLVAEDIRRVAGMATWQPEAWAALLDRYDATPEMLMQRFTNVLPRHFGLNELFFLRMQAGKDLQQFWMTKELHLSQPHNPYANEANEQYCRRWLSIDLLKQLRTQGGPAMLTEAQVSEYWQTPNAYLCLSFAKRDALQPQNQVSITLGLLVNEALHKTFAFLDDPALRRRVVHTTCEQCGIAACSERVSPPTVIERAAAQLEMDKALRRLDEMEG